jgi:hypothetical protein
MVLESKDTRMNEKILWPVNICLDDPMELQQRRAYQLGWQEFPYD